jgi:hypothetical protein
MNESYSHSSFFIATARQNKDFQISHTLKLAWVLSSCMFLVTFAIITIVKGEHLLPLKNVMSPIGFDPDLTS